jgi:hypothetical protein
MLKVVVLLSVTLSCDSGFVPVFLPGKLSFGGTDGFVAAERRGYEVTARRNFYFGRSQVC